MVKRKSKKYPRLVDITFDDGTVFNNALPIGNILSSKYFNCYYDGNEYFLYKNRIYNQNKEIFHKILILGGSILPISSNFNGSKFFNDFILKCAYCRVFKYTGIKVTNKWGEIKFVSFEPEWSITCQVSGVSMTITQDTTLEDYVKVLKGELLNTSTFIRRYNIC